MKRLVPFVAVAAIVVLLLLSPFLTLPSTLAILLAVAVTRR